ncbi:GDYXXLXY domain-containing protein [Sungkyunkwania multivorans]|uniref:GDYXXLXY domain-containing protein n=1 Tax=Sungkyunkwania multivorans TaxID=1173618 RepID=A0ABW3CT97_9FLAO
MKKAFAITTFTLLLIAQWLVPGNMIYLQERAIIAGTPYKFRTQPIDPSDPFRGKYITLNYELRSFETKDTVNRNKDIYVYLEKDSLGFAKVSAISEKPLDLDNDFVMAKATGYYSGKQNFRLPFDRFYMEESKAYDAELAVRRTQFDSLPNNCYALVYVEGATAVLTDVLIDDISIKEFVEKE